MSDSITRIPISILVGTAVIVIGDMATLVMDVYEYDSAMLLAADEPNIHNDMLNQHVMHWPIVSNSLHR